MDFEKNKINTTIWSHINRAEEMIKDKAKPFFPIKRIYLGTEMSLTITDLEFLDKMISNEINENTRAEVLNALVESDVLTIGETIKLIENSLASLKRRVLNEKENKLTTFLKGVLYKISQN